MHMISKILIIICISFSLNDDLVPDKVNAITLDEYEIRCYIGTITYKINNYQNNKYLLLIKASSFTNYALYEEDKKLSYESNINNDYFYPINTNKILYLVAKTISSYCFSYKFTDSNYINLKNDEEYLHPIVNYETVVETTIRNLANKHFIFSVKNTRNAYSIYINGKEYRIYSSNEIISLIPKESEIKIKVKITTDIIVASLKYISASYSNITDDTFKYINNADEIQTYFINQKESKNYIFISFSNNKTEFYENDAPVKTFLNNIFFFYLSNYFFMPRDKGYFQILYLDNSYIEIKDGDSFTIINSDTYIFKIDNDNDNNKKDNMKLEISSDENNFIKKIKIGNSYKTLNIKKGTYYTYTFSFTPGILYTYLYINFNLNSKEILNVYFSVKREKADKDYDWVYVLMFPLGVFLFIILYFVYRFCRLKMKEKKEQKDEEIKLVEKKILLSEVSDLYSQIEKDYTLINKVCLFCRKNDVLYLEDNYYNNKENEFIDDINNGTFENLFDYITPKKCSHLYHEDCCKKNKIKRENIKKNPKKCRLCDCFITLENMQKFGCFFTKNFFEGLFTRKEYEIGAAKEEIIKKIEGIAYSKVDSSEEIDTKKKEKLMKLKRVNQRYLKNYYDLFRGKRDYWYYYKLNINDIDDSIEEDLENDMKEIKNRILENQRRFREKKEQNRPISLRVCGNCKNICYFCGGNVRETRRNSVYVEKTLCVHNKCMTDKLFYLCFICGKNQGKQTCTTSTSVCKYCDKKNPAIGSICLSCEENID